MSLSNFFRINFPYGIMKRKDDKWTCFNREYLPLGWNDKCKNLKEEDFTYTSYKRLTNRFLESLANEKSSLEYDSDNNVKKVWFYNDETNPTNSNSKKDWDNYNRKLQLLSGLEVKNY